MFCMAGSHMTSRKGGRSMFCSLAKGCLPCPQRPFLLYGTATVLTYWIENRTRKILKIWFFFEWSDEVRAKREPSHVYLMAMRLFRVFSNSVLFFQTVCYNTWYVWFRKIRWKRMRLRGSIQGWSVGGSTFFECPCVNRVPQNAFELWCNTCLEASHAFGLCRTFLWTAQWAKILHSGWKSQKKSHSTFWATLSFWVGKSWLKMPKNGQFWRFFGNLENATFLVIFNHCAYCIIISLFRGVEEKKVKFFLFESTSQYSFLFIIYNRPEIGYIIKLVK